MTTPSSFVSVLSSTDVPSTHTPSPSKRHLVLPLSLQVSLSAHLPL